MPEVKSTVRYYKTLSPDDIIGKRMDIAKLAFNIREGDALIQLIVDRNGYFYYRNKKSYNDRNKWIKNKTEALKVLKYHLSILNQKLQIAISGDPGKKTNVQFLVWENLEVVHINPSIKYLGNFYSWKATINVVLPGISMEHLGMNERMLVVGEYIEVEFTLERIIELNYLHLPVTSSQTAIIPFKIAENEMILNQVALYRTISDALYPYYNLGGSINPVIENLGKTIQFLPDDVPLPEPQIIGDDNSILQITSGISPDNGSGQAGNLTVKINLDVQILGKESEGDLNYSLMQAGNVNLAISNVIKNELGNMVVMFPPEEGSSFSLEFIENPQSRHTKKYYELSVQPNIKISYNPKSNIWDLFQWSNSPVYNNKGIICISPEIPDTTPITNDLVILSQHRIKILDAEYVYGKDSPATPATVMESIYNIDMFCIINGHSVALLEMIKDQVELYENKILIVGSYVYEIVKDEISLNYKLSELNIILVPDEETGLQLSPNTPKINMLTVFNRVSFFEATSFITMFLKTYLKNTGDFSYKYKGKYVKHFAILNYTEKLRALIINPDLYRNKTVSTEELLTTGILDMFNNKSEYSKNIDISQSIMMTFKIPTGNYNYNAKVLNV